MNFSPHVTINIYPEKEDLKNTIISLYDDVSSETLRIKLNRITLEALKRKLDFYLENVPASRGQ